MPIGIAGAIRKGMDAIKAKGYTIEEPCMMLDDETGLFSADMLIALKETPENDPNLVRDGAPTLMLLMDGIIEGNPQDARALAAAACGPRWWDSGKAACF